MCCASGFASDAWDAFAPPADPEYDWIQLDTGEWLKGDLKVMYDQSLEFDSDKMETQEFDFEDVVKVRTRNEQRILIQEKGRDSRILTGVLEIDQDQVLIRDGENEQRLARSEVVAIAQRAERERNRWSGSLSIGLNMRGGNSETIDANVSANLKRQTALTRYNFDYLANYSGTRDEETANNQRVSMDANVFLSSRFFWRVIEAEFYRDLFSNIDRQYSVHTGVGYYLFRNPNVEWAFGAGAGYQRTEYISVEAGEDDVSESPYLAAGTTLDYEINNHVDYLLDYSFRLLNESNGSYTHHLVTTLSMDLFGDNFDGDISLVWDRVEKPTADSSGRVPEQDDYQLIFSLAYEF